MLRTIAVALPIAAATITLAACGSGEPAKSSGAVAPETAKARIEHAAHLRLKAAPVPDDAREQGLRAAFSNAATVVKDRQVVGLFVMKNADVADKVSDMVRGSAPKSARLLVNDAVMVVYAPAGADRSRAVERALEAL
jgi:hypothetical protein